MPFNITDSQLSILFILTKKGGLTQKQLSDIIRLEKSSLNRNLKRLFDKNYLSRADFPTIRITHLGKSFVNDIIPEWKKAMNEISQLLEEDGKNALDLVHTKLINLK
ncbi:MAG: MarR family transcriptional regulator [Flavobacteriaceae bacterium]|nr:MarR family transcriptional regulator [Flavobacteriaceae bacterium]